MIREYAIVDCTGEIFKTCVTERPQRDVERLYPQFTVTPLEHMSIEALARYEKWKDVINNLENT